jgi:transposase
VGLACQRKRSEDPQGSPDNLSAQKGKRVKELIETQGCDLLYLPPYSADLDPIEEAFSKIKGLLRQAGARTREALVEAMGVALRAVSVRDAHGFFEHCGYRPPGQPPPRPM